MGTMIKTRSKILNGSIDKSPGILIINKSINIEIQLIICEKFR